MTAVNVKTKQGTPRSTTKTGVPALKNKRTTKGRAAPMFGQAFVLNATSNLDAARSESRRAAAKMRMNRVNSRMAQSRRLIEVLQSYSKES